MFAHGMVPVYECDYSLREWVTPKRAEQIVERHSYAKVIRDGKGKIRRLYFLSREGSPPIVDRVMPGTRYTYREKLPQAAKVVWTFKSVSKLEMSPRWPLYLYD